MQKRGLKMRKHFVITIGALMLLTLMMSAQGQEPFYEELVDESDDVMSEEYNEIVVEGHDDIDITGMTLEVTLTDATVTFSVKGDIKIDDDHSYDFSAGAINFYMWDGEPDVYPSSANYTINGGTVSVTAQLSDLYFSDPLIMSGESEYYGFDYTSDYYYVEDSIMDIGYGNGEDVRSENYRQIFDPEGDVTAEIYEEVPVSGKDYLDIIKITVEELTSGDFEITMEMAGDVYDTSKVDYSMDIDDADISYSNGEGYVYYYEGYGSEEFDISASGREITAVLDGTRINEIDYIWGYASEDDWENGTSCYDMVSNDPWDNIDIDDLEDIDMEMAIEIDFLEVDLVEIRLTYHIGGGMFTDLMRDEFDDNDDGQITEDEVESLFDDPETVEEEIIEAIDVQIDGESGTSTYVFEHSGILGPTESSEDIEVVMKFVVEFELDDADEHDVSIVIDASESNEEETYDEESDSIESISEDSFYPMVFRVILPDEWGILTATLEPAEFKEYLNEGKTLIEISGEELNDMEEPEDELLSFTMEHDEDQYERVDIADDDDDGDDSPVPAAVVLSSLVLSVIGLGYFRSRRRK